MINRQENVTPIPNAFARGLLFSVDESKIPEVTGLSDEMIPLVDGGNMSSYEFVTLYAAANNRVIEGTHSTLGGTPSIEQLQEQYEEATRAVRSKQIPSVQSTGMIDGLNRYIVWRLSQIAEGDVDYTRQAVLGMALMTMEIQTMREQARERMDARSHDITIHRQLVREALAIASEKGMTEALVHLYHAKKQAGMNPRIRFVSDMDFTLTDKDSNAGLKPGNALTPHVDVLDRFSQTPWYQRLVLLDALEDDPHFGELAHQALVQAGVQSEIFEDGRHALALAHNANIPMTLLTANMAEVARSLRYIVSGNPDFQVAGLGPRSMISYYKPTYLARMVFTDPEDIIIMCEDGDHPITDAIRNGQVDDAIAIPLEELVLFASRVTGENETKVWRVAQALQEKNIPFAPNRRTVTAEGIQGYQCATSLLHTAVQLQMS